MTIDVRSLDRLADRAGVEIVYRDIWGEPHEVSDESKRAILSSLGIAAHDDAAVEASLAAIEEEPWRLPLPRALVVRQGETPRIPLVLPAEEAGRELEWTLVEEGGAQREGWLRPSCATVLGIRHLDGHALERRAVELPLAPPAGYHELRLPSLEGGVTLELIVVPARCYLPPPFSEGGRPWGIAVQLYTLVSRRNWGIGDLTDLADLLEQAAALGASSVGINPLHALFPDEPECASPYTSSSRLQLNPLYLDPVAIPEFQECQLARDLAGSSDFREALAAARRSHLVDYTAAAGLKGRILEELYLWFRRTHLPRHTARAERFRRFQAEGGHRLRYFSAFQALTEFFGHRRWREWPQAYRHPASERVAQFSGHRVERLEFFQYLQWQTDAQLAAAQRRAEALGMTPGVYGDLAVGVDPDGADAWAEQETTASGSRIGAPPDPFQPVGQEWGLLPLHPRALRKTGYDYFIAALRANMRNAGALRIDHAMGLRRMFWIPVGEDPVSGAYVRYPHEDLLGILALESHRNRCLVIGEDLGTVPEGFRERMAAAGALSYRVIYFEKEGDRFKRPADYPGLSLACASTHDLPTLVGFWEERDLMLRKQLGLYPSEEARLEEHRARKRDRRMLLQALAAEGLLPASVDPERPEETAMTRELIHAVHTYLARTPTCLLMVQLDDLLGEADQVNLPGTVSERPNWRRKLSCELEEIGADPTVRALAEALRRLRPDGCPLGSATRPARGERRQLSRASGPSAV